MKSPERSFCLRAINEVLYKGGRSNELVDLYTNKLERLEQKAFFTKLFMGTLENILYLDEVISGVSSRKIKDIDRITLNILRISVYQILFLDSVPDSACVDCGVELCSENKRSKSKGFVNAVLRNILRSGNVPKYFHSVPKWMYEYIGKSIPENISINSLFNNFSKGHCLTLRVNINKIAIKDLISEFSSQNILCEQVEDLPVIRITQGISPRLLPGFDEGLFYIQDISSIRAVIAAGIRPGMKVIDVCSAPGGKGIFASELVGDKGFVSLRDVSEAKTDIIRKNVKRYQIKNVKIKEQDATLLDVKDVGKYDVVIADLPCSGLGTIGNKPEIKYRIRMEDIESLAKLQSSILRTVCEYVCPGGRMLFSTCSISKLENEDNTAAFLHDKTQFGLLEEKLLLPDGKGSDGFYYALMERKANEA